MLEKYAKEQADLETSIQNTLKEISAFEEDNTRIDKFMELVRKYTDFSELTTPMIHEFRETCFTWILYGVTNV